MNIYEKIDYRSIIKNTIMERKRIDAKINFQRMAEKIRVPKSYLSRVFKEQANLNSDQMDLACGYLEFSEEETEYMQLLLEYERSSLQSRKNKLKQQIKKIQLANLETDKHLQTVELSPTSASAMNEYYLDPIHQIVHVSLSIARIKKEPLLLCAAFSISSQRLNHILMNLERMDLIERTPTGIVTKKNSLHLDRGSILYRAWKNQLKLMGMQRMDSLAAEDAYSFSVVFSCDETIKNQVQNLFLNFLKETEKLVKEATSKHTYQMTFDLFKWF